MIMLLYNFIFDQLANGRNSFAELDAYLAQYAEVMMIKHGHKSIIELQLATNFGTTINTFGDSKYQGYFSEK